MTQEEYIAILFADCGYDTASQRKGWLQKRFSKSFADELSSIERSRAIASLKKEKTPLSERRCLCHYDALCCPVHDPTGARD